MSKWLVRIIILGVFIVGFGVYFIVIPQQAQKDFDTKVAEADAAYEAGDCEKAEAIYDGLGRHKQYSKATLELQGEIINRKGVCINYNASYDALEDNNLSYILSYYKYTLEKEGIPPALYKRIQDDMVTYFTNNSLDQAIAKENCHPVDDNELSLVDILNTKGVLPEPEVNYPKILFLCAQKMTGFETLQDDVITILSKFLEVYPEHELAEQAETLLAEAIVAKSANAPEIAQPVAIAGSNTTAAILQIENASPEGIRLTFIGPDTQVEYIPACSTCQAFNFPPPGCPPTDQSATYELPPGTYQIVVESIGQYVTPYYGSWTLEAGFDYPQCFYIVNQ